VRIFRNQKGAPGVSLIVKFLGFDVAAPAVAEPQQPQIRRTRGRFGKMEAGLLACRFQVVRIDDFGR
jgi:hypothetical protein